MLKIIEVPKLGESVTEITILKILIKPGQVVQQDDDILEYSNDKIDGVIPSEYTGMVKEIFVSVDDTVAIGTQLVAIETATDAIQPDLPKPISKVVDHPVATPDSESPRVAETTPAPPKVQHLPTAFSSGKASKVAQLVAKDLGLDIQVIVQSMTENRRVLKKDVLHFASQQLKKPVSVAEALPLPDFARFGTVEILPLNSIGYKTATHLSQVWTTVPHAWMMEKADITNLDFSRNMAKNQTPNLSWTAIYAKAVVGILKQFPNCNASVDLSEKRIVLKKHYHIGIAVDTPKGLVVPVIRDADRKSLSEIGTELARFSSIAKGQGGSFTPDDFEGHTFTISNVGMIGSTGILPIVHAPDSAILGLTSAHKEVIWDEAEGCPKPRLMLPMTLGFDHRVVNGAEASRFLAALKSVLEGPVLAMF